MILSAHGDEALYKKLNSAVFPGTQGGPLMHVIAGKAVAFKEALEPEFQTYSRQVVANARAMAQVFMDRNYEVVSGGTDNHLMLVSLVRQDITGKDAEALLGKAHITANKNAVPGDPRSPFVTSGLRIGTPAATTRGFDENEMRQVAGWICDVLDTLPMAAMSTPWSPGCRRRSPISAPGTRSIAGRRAPPSCVVRGVRHAVSVLRRARHARGRLAPGCGRQPGAASARMPGVQCPLTTFETAELVLPRIVKSDGTPGPSTKTSYARGRTGALQAPGGGRSHRHRDHPHTPAPAYDAEREVASRQLGEGERNCANSTRWPTSASPRCIAVSRTSTPFARRSNGSRRRPTRTAAVADRRRRKDR